jgi:hypothetical protein
MSLTWRRLQKDIIVLGLEASELGETSSDAARGKEGKVTFVDLIFCCWPRW